MKRYLVELTTPTITSVIVVADSVQEASERALNAEGHVTGTWTESADVTRVKALEE